MPYFPPSPVRKLSPVLVGELSPNEEHRQRHPQGELAFPQVDSPSKAVYSPILRDNVTLTDSVSPDVPGSPTNMVMPDVPVQALVHGTHSRGQSVSPVYEDCQCVVTSIEIAPAGSMLIEVVAKGNGPMYVLPLAGTVRLNPMHEMYPEEKQVTGLLVPMGVAMKKGADFLPCIHPKNPITEASYVPKANLVSWLLNPDPEPFRGLVVQVKEGTTWHDARAERDYTPDGGGAGFLNADLIPKAQGAARPSGAAVGQEMLFEDSACVVWDNWLMQGMPKVGSPKHKHEYDHWVISMGFEGAVLSTEYTKDGKNGKNTATPTYPSCQAVTKGALQLVTNKGTEPYRALIVQVKC